MRPFRRSGAVQPPTDSELFDQFLAGDDHAFAGIVTRHSQRLFAYCVAYLHDAEAARDVMQEAWERLARMRGKKEAVPNPAGLLVSMVRNLSLNYIRDRRNHISVDELTDRQHPASAPAEPSYLEEMVMLAMERLPIPQREVLILKLFSDYDYDEIARILNLSIDAVRMRAMRGRAHLAGLVEAMVRIEDERIDAMDEGTRNLIGAHS